MSFGTRLRKIQEAINKINYNAYTDILSSTIRLILLCFANCCDEASYKRYFCNDYIIVNTYRYRAMMKFV